MNNLLRVILYRYRGRNPIEAKIRTNIWTVLLRMLSLYERRVNYRTLLYYLASTISFLRERDKPLARITEVKEIDSSKWTRLAFELNDTLLLMNVLQLLFNNCNKLTSCFAQWWGCVFEVFSDRIAEMTQCVYSDRKKIAKLTWCSGKCLLPGVERYSFLGSIYIYIYIT